MRKCIRKGGSGEQGSVLVLSLMILAVLGVVIAALSTDVSLDLNISRNVRLKSDAFNWGESGMLVTEELVTRAMDLRGEDNGTAFSKTIGGDTFVVLNAGDSLMLSNGTVTLSRNGQNLSEVDVRFLGSKTGDGNSIIIAAGYEGFGMGAGSGVSRQFFYHLTATGNSTTGNGRFRMSEVYSHVAR